MVISNYQTGKLISEEIFLLMMIPGIDMFRLFVERIARKKNPFKGDRNHLHHILLNSFSEKSFTNNNFLNIDTKFNIIFF